MPTLYGATVPLPDNRPIDDWKGMALIGCEALSVIGAVLGLRRQQ